MLRALGMAGAILLVATGCASAPGPTPIAQMEHIHSVAADMGNFYLASHHGIYEWSDQGWNLVGEEFDAMGLTIDKGVFYASGHPGPGQDFPNPLGILESRDNGDTWTPKSLTGEVDFHLLEVSGDAMVGVAANYGVVVGSQDGAVTWSNIATATAEEDVYQALQAALPAGLTALALSGASDQDSYNVTSDFAMKNNLTSIADLAGVSGIRLGGAPELAERPYGPTGLLGSYGVTVEFEATGDTTVESLVAGLIDMANVYSADPRIQQLGLVTLTDPQGLFLSSNLVPIASDAVNQKARDLISAVSSAMTAADLVALNVRSVDEQLSSAEIATDWLVSKGLID